MTELQTKSFDQVTKNDSYPSQRRKGTFSWGCFTAERITVLIIIIIIIISSSSSILVKLSNWVRQKKPDNLRQLFPRRSNNQARTGNS